MYVLIEVIDGIPHANWMREELAPLYIKLHTERQKDGCRIFYIKLVHSQETLNDLRMQSRLHRV